MLNAVRNFNEIIRAYCMAMTAFLLQMVANVNIAEKQKAFL